MRTTNLAGGTYSLMVLTPIRPGQEDELRAYLEALPRDDSPLARLERTHMARLLIIDDMPAPPGRPDLADPLDGAYLMFTSNFDGDLGSYLHELAERLAPEVGEIWGRCIGCPDPAVGPAALAAYLGRNQLQSGVVFAAYGQATRSRGCGRRSTSVSAWPSSSFVRRTWTRGSGGRPFGRSSARDDRRSPGPRRHPGRHPARVRQCLRLHVVLLRAHR